MNKYFSIQTLITLDEKNLKNWKYACELFN